MKLNEWSVISRSKRTLEPPEAERICLQGVVEGHYRCVDGKQVITSRVIGRNGDKIATFSGSEYELGETSAFYEFEYPNAKDRLLANLPPVRKQDESIVLLPAS